VQNQLKIVIPVYNEGENFPSLRSALQRAIRSPFEVFIIYDFDLDNTIPAVQRAIEEGDTRFHLVKNAIRPGIAGALQTGFKSVRRGPVLVVMGDLSDDLGIVDRMLSLYRQGYQLVAASRYARGGQMLGGPLFKRSLSKCAGLTLHWFRRLPTSDATNAFKLYDAEMLNSLNLESCSGFEIGLEITVKAFLAGYRIAEVPTTWQDRIHGESRFQMRRWLPLYLRWYLYAFRPRLSLRPVEVTRSAAELSACPSESSRLRFSDEQAI
jgi:dolichol-phosphate mannosyltransferase